MQTSSNKFKRCVIIIAVTYQTFIPHPASPSFSIILLTHGQEHVPYIDSYRTAQCRNNVLVQTHQFIPSSIHFLNSLHVPLVFTLCEFFKNLYQLSTFSSEQCRELPCCSASQSLHPGQRHVSHLKEEPKPCDFPNQVAPLEFSLDRATRPILFGYLVEHRSALQNFRDRI